MKVIRKLLKALEFNKNIIMAKQESEISFAVIFQIKEVLIHKTIKR